jgi:hypothetical protein
MSRSHCDFLRSLARMAPHLALTHWGDVLLFADRDRCQMLDSGKVALDKGLGW